MSSSSLVKVPVGAAHLQRAFARLAISEILSVANDGWRSYDNPTNAQGQCGNLSALDMAF